MGVKLSPPISDSPGPGAYTIPENKKEGISMGMKLSPPQSDGPGPGKYDLPTTEHGPKYTIAGRTTGPAPKPSPGPGAYEAPKAPRRGISMGKRVLTVTRQSPEYVLQVVSLNMGRDT
uniref:Uncharacterized protein n=1 Tax=Eutreptiella gymnastica TaxID=73025 RepID=A0A7S1JFP1_9EUGL